MNSASWHLPSQAGTGTGTGTGTASGTGACASTYTEPDHANCSEGVTASGNVLLLPSGSESLPTMKYAIKGKN